MKFIKITLRNIYSGGFNFLFNRIYIFYLIVNNIKSNMSLLNGVISTKFLNRQNSLNVYFFLFIRIKPNFVLTNFMLINYINNC